MDDAIRHLASNALFRGLDESVLRLLAEDAFVREVKAGETLFEPGDARSDMLLVLSGRLEIRSGELREAGEIVLLGPGGCVGEAGLLEPSVHTGAGRPRLNLWAQAISLARAILPASPPSRPPAQRRLARSLPGPRTLGAALSASRSSRHPGNGSDGAPGRGSSMR